MAKYKIGQQIPIKRGDGKIIGYNTIEGISDEKDLPGVQTFNLGSDVEIDDPNALWWQKGMLKGGPQSKIYHEPSGQFLDYAGRPVTGDIEMAPAGTQGLGILRGDPKNREWMSKYAQPVQPVVQPTPQQGGTIVGIGAPPARPRRQPSQEDVMKLPFIREPEQPTRRQYDPGEVMRLYGEKPPAGATLISGPSGLKGLTEAQIWRDPNSKNIYKLPPGTPPLPSQTLQPLPPQQASGLSPEEQIAMAAQQQLVPPGAQPPVQPPSEAPQAPPEGSTLISGPSGLKGLTEAQIWRDPTSNKIYKLPEQKRTNGERIEDFVKKKEPEIPTPTEQPGVVDPPPSVPAGPIQTSDQIRAEGLAKQKAELAPTTPAPTPYKSLDEYTRLRKEQGIAQDEEELAALRQEALLGKQEMRQFRSRAGEQVSEAGRIGGVSEAERNLNFRLEGLAIREQGILSRINTKNATISTMLQIGQSDYNTALNAYNAEYNKNVKAVELYNDQLDDQQKDALTSITTINNLLKDRNVDFSQLDPSIITQLDSAGVKIGLPPGTLGKVLSTTPGQEMQSTMTVENATGGKDIYAVMKGAPGQPPSVKKLSSIAGPGKAPIEVSPGATLVDSTTGKPIYTAPTAKQVSGGGTSTKAASPGAASVPSTAPSTPGTPQLSDEAQAIVSGVLQLQDLTPTVRGDIAGELIRSGYKSPTALSSTQQESVAHMATVRDLIDKLLDYNKDGVLEGVGLGLTKGTIGQTLSKIFGTGSDEAKSVRALIGNVKATIAKLRGGTAFTANEEKLLDTYTPTINDHPNVVINKLELLKDFINKGEVNLYRVTQLKVPGQKETDLSKLRSKYDY